MPAETLLMDHWCQWLILILSGFAIGLAKTGLPGVGILAVPFMAMAFPAKASVGLLLPILIFADLFAVGYYRHLGQWRHLFGLLPWALAGIAGGYGLSLIIQDNTHFKRVIGIIVLVMLILRFHTMVKPQTEQTIPHHWSFAGTMGFAAGVTTMMANAAGPVMTLYLLSMRFDKKHFIGTAAWFFFIVNWVKVPLQANLGTITYQSLKLDLAAFPAVIFGALAGIWLLKRIPQRLFNIIALLLAAAASIKLLF